MKQIVSKTELLNVKIESEPLVSIIIPLYNAEPYLARCLYSVLAQSYNNLEIILVDDGSTDNSGFICDEYSEQDERVHVIHQTNQGQSVARNTGVQAATGDYVAFVDSDDEIVLEYIQIMLAGLLFFGADIVQTRIKIIDAAVKSETNNPEKIEALLYCPGKYAANDMNYKVSPCAKVYRTDLVKSNPFPSHGANEDDASYYRFAYKAKRIAVLNYFSYFYYQTDNSVMRSANRLKDKKTDYIRVYYERIQYFEEKNEAELLQGTRNRFCLVVMLNYAAYKMEDTNQKDLPELFRIFKEQYELIRDTKTIGWIRGAMYWAFYHFPNISAALIWIIRR